MSSESKSLQGVFAVGICGGILASVSLAVGQAVIGLVLGATPLVSVRLTGSIILGPAALSAAFPPILAGLAFVVVHFSLSAAYGAVFSLVVASRGWPRLNAGLLLLAGSAYGAIVWSINYLVIAEIAWAQFAVVDLVWGGVLPHAILFGLPLAVFVLGARRRFDDSTGATPIQGRAN